MPEIPAEIIQAMEAGELSMDQLRELIRLEASALNLSFNEAVAMARAGKLPRNLIGDDLDLLVELLPAA